MTPGPICPKTPAAAGRGDRHGLVRPFSLAAIVAFVLVAIPVSAQDVGIRGGVSGDPDQFFIGAHFDTGPFVERLHFRPNLEVGFGDNATLIALNFEFAWFFPLRRHPWSLYAGGGPALNIYNFDRDGSPGVDDNDTDVQPGLNFLFGIEHRRGFFTELKLGLIDSPEVKFAVGYTFK